MNNQELFETTLVNKFTVLFANDPRYAVVSRKYTPEELAAITVKGLLDGTADKDGVAVRGVCRQLDIKHTYKGIRTFLEGR